MALYSAKQLKPIRYTRAEVAANLEESVALSYPYSGGSTRRGRGVTSFFSVAPTVVRTA